MDIEQLRTRREQLKGEAEAVVSKMEATRMETERIAGVATNAEMHLADLERQFAAQTGLNKTDLGFLFFAVALQCVRQYVLTPFEQRLNDADAAKKVKNGVKEASNRTSGLYQPTLPEIISNPVPYDAIFGSPTFNLNLSGHSHRYRTLGHDPLLGWVFGTSNILTSTLTTWDFQSYHVRTGRTMRGDARDLIASQAETLQVLDNLKRQLLDEGKEGKAMVAAALIKQGIHYKSDMHSTAGIPLPVISTLSPQFAQQVAKYGLDFANVLTVGKQAAYAATINMLIAMVHRLCFDAARDGSERIYEVKTRKILSYSNLIASTSNVLYVALQAYAGDKSQVKYLDIGGLIVTIHRLLSDAAFIQQVKEEFVFGGFKNKLDGVE